MGYFYLDEDYKDGNDETNCRDYLYDLETYEFAKEGVLFKGWRHTVELDAIWVSPVGHNYMYFLYQYSTLEDMISSSYKLELTQTALKQIGL